MCELTVKEARVKWLPLKHFLLHWHRTDSPSLGSTLVSCPSKASAQFHFDLRYKPNGYVLDHIESI